MGATNFDYRNADKIYPVGMLQKNPDYDGDEDDEPEYYQEDWEDIKNWLKQELSEKEFEPFTKGEEKWFKDPFECRGYESVPIAAKYYEGKNCRVLITVLIRSGYYEGGCMDYLWKVEVGDTFGWEEMPDVEEIQYELERDYEWQNIPKNLAKIHAPQKKKELEKLLDKAHQKFESIMSELIDEPLKVLYRASNGKTNYAPV